MHTMTAVINTITEGCACAEANIIFTCADYETDCNDGIVQIKNIPLLMISQIGVRVIV